MPSKRILFRPRDAYFGDVNPIYADGAFHLLYVSCVADDLDLLNGTWRGLDWSHVVTTDFVNFTELPMAIPRGGPRSREPLAGAGSVTRGDDGRYVAFYAGLQPSPEPGRPEQVVLRAYSDDLVHWEKDPEFELWPDERFYARDCLRDPFVYRDDSSTWRMISAAQVKTGPLHRRGAIGLATSADLDHWDFQEPVLSPGTTLTPECPEYFADWGRHYLVYSTYSERFATRYRIGDGPDGPWRMPAEDALESADVYAVKTVSDGSRRLAIGWLSTRSGDRDTGDRQWGGDLVAHELVPRPDGTLGQRPVPEFVATFAAAPAHPEPRHGQWQVGDAGARFDGRGFGWCSLGQTGQTCMLDVTVDLDEAADEVGIGIRSDAEFNSVYLIRLEPKLNRFVFDRRPHEIVIPFDPDGDRAYVTVPDHSLERPLHLQDGKARVKVILDGTAIIVYVNDVAMSTRGYGKEPGEWGVYAAGAPVTFSEFSYGSIA